MRIVPYAPEHRPGTIALFAAELWPSYTREPQRTCQALRAPGVTSLVALEDGGVPRGVGRPVEGRPSRFGRRRGVTA